MLEMDKNTLQTTLSLLLLREALTSAAAEAPADPPYVDRNELMAETLIDRVRMEFRNSTTHASDEQETPFANFRLQELISQNA